MPFIYPVRPLLAFCSTLSSRGGKATWLRARSKNKGLHGMGWKPGGKCTRLTCLLTREGSRQKVSNRSESGWKRPVQKHKLKKADKCQTSKEDWLSSNWDNRSWSSLMTSWALEDDLNPCQNIAAGSLENLPMCREKAKLRKKKKDAILEEVSSCLAPTQGTPLCQPPSRLAEWKQA